MEDPYAYVTRDYSAVNNHIDEAYRRAHEITRLKRVNIFAKYAMYSSALICAIALASVLGAFAYWLAFAPPRPETKIIEIEKPIIIEKPIVLRPKQEGSVVKPQIPAAVREFSERATSYSKEGGDNKVVTNFTLFTRVPFNVDGITSVVTGAQFPDSDQDHPSFQYCYIELPMFRGKSILSNPKKTITISSKIGKEKIYRVGITREIAEKLGTTIGTVQVAQTRCKFI